MNNQGYIKTLEAMLAVVMTFAVMAYILPTNENNGNIEAKKMLITLSLNDDFRDNALNLTTCIKKEDNTTLNTMILSEINTHHDYKLCLSGVNPNLPRKDVSAESYYLTTKYSDKEPKIIRFYYWE